MNYSLNQRYLSSQEKIQQSTLALLDSHDPKKITISLICKTANINRSTFYSYYKSFDDLLEKLETNMTQKLISIYHEGVTFTREFFRSNEFLLPFLKFIQDHQTFVRFYLENKQSYPLSSSFSFLWEEIALPFAKENNISSEDDLLYYYIFFQSGSFMIIKHWLKNSCKETPEHIAKIIQNCLLKDLRDDVSSATS